MHKMYKGKPLNRKHFKNIRKFYYNRVKVDIVEKSEQKNINNILKTILGNSENGGRFSVHPTAEGSAAVGLQVGKSNELDFSVEILLRNEPLQLSDKPIKFKFKHGDVDRKNIDEISSTEFVKRGKRYFPEDERSLRSKHNPPEILNGYTAVRTGKADSKFSDCYIKMGGKYYLLPYLLLSEFHHFVENAISELDGVTLKRGAQGPAITLIIEQDNGPDISVDITPKLTLSSKTLKVTDSSWPRRKTRRRLAEKIENIVRQHLYLVPKGDKYWKISFANCENEILRNIDEYGTCRKRCLRIMKKKLMQWKSKSSTGLKGLSSYLLKTTLLWLCEMLPNDRYWSKENMGKRYLDFLREFAKRLRSRSLGEYFNPSVNLLKNKDEECIDELVQFLEEEISLVQGDTDTSDDTDVEDFQYLIIQ